MKEAAAKTPRNRPCYRWRSYSPSNRPRRRLAGSSRDCCRRQGILFVGGEPKVGKSLLVANLALALAAGKDRAGFPIPAARRVLVCQFELPTPQFVARLASMRRSVGAAADQNLLVDTRAGGNLLSAPQGLNHFLNAARQAAAEVIVLDPLYSTHDQDENDTRSMAALCQSLLRLRDASKAALIVVHHVRKSIGREEIGSAFRGSSALHAVGDSYLLLTRPSAHLSATVELRFQFRYAAPPEPRLLQLDPADVVLFRRRPGALQGCRRAQEGGTRSMSPRLWPASANRRVITNCASRSWISPIVPGAPRNWPSPRPAGKAPSCRPTASIVCRFDSRDFAPGRAGANPAPRGVGARGWRRICSPDLFLSPTPPEPTAVSAGFVFSKTEYWDQLPSLSRSQNAKPPRRAFGAGAFLMDFLAGYPVLPIQRSILSPTAPVPCAIAATCRQRGM